MSTALVLVAVLLAPSCSAAPDRRRLSADGYYQFTGLDALGLPVLSFVSASGGRQAVLPPGAATETPLAEAQEGGGAASGTAKPDGSVVDESVQGVPIGIPSVPVGEGPVRDVERPAPVRDVLIEVPAGEVALVNITVVQVPARDVPAGAAPVVVSSPEGVPVEASVVGAAPPAARSGDAAPEGVPRRRLRRRRGRRVDRPPWRPWWWRPPPRAPPRRGAALRGRPGRGPAGAGRGRAHVVRGGKLAENDLVFRVSFSFLFQRRRPI
ncbi:hypothetical protein C7M84_010033 [Penaeus vannamei]|uniref:Uncharacterized protein n=1 Tax=Penaeus vannamei TaxID=6689 RepID=A0A3R7P055_PENVA|nr:uncharacterized protein LOC113811901 [Penaeus vannamei]ROT71641.1 hypothetical protein C7M84_010033 [Penaeus vannamei]